MSDPAVLLSEQRDFQKGAQLYAEGRYWEAHEAWEKVWRNTTEPETRLLMQGLIQVCAALYKVYEKRDAEAAARLFQRAVNKLEELPDVVQGVHVASFRAAASECRDVMEHGQDQGTLGRERIPRLAVLLVPLLVCFMLAGCTSCNDQRTPAGGATADSGGLGAAVTTTGSASSGRADTGSADGIHEDGRAYVPQTFTFAVAKTDMWIEDTKMGTALDEVLARTGGTLAINGGFFDTNERPLGLAVSQKKTLSAFSKTMSGGVLTIDVGGDDGGNGDAAAVTATEEYQADAHAGARFAVQCRPRLVVDGKLNIKRDDGKRSARTALCVKDAGKTLSAVLVRDASDPSFGPSLYALATYLAATGCKSALNLDGGPSTGAAWREGDSVRVEKPVAGIRHAIVFRPIGQ